MRVELRVSVRASRVRVGDDKHLEAFVSCIMFAKPVVGGEDWALVRN